MREIFFRGKWADNGKWFYGSYFDFGKTCFIYSSDNRSRRVIPETVGQYTGLTDKNGKRIFEGDILQNKCGTVFHNSYKFVVRISDGVTFGFNEWVSLDANVFDECKLVGNIHDNPELLKGE